MAERMMSARTDPGAGHGVRGARPGGAAMRLTPGEAAAIRAATAEVFGPAARVRLFGSRVDDRLRGGDIDLLVEAPAGRAGFAEECALLGAIEDRLGERRVDVLLLPEGRAPGPMERAALREGVLLDAASCAGAAPPPPRRMGAWREVRMEEVAATLRAAVAAARRVGDALSLSVAELAGVLPATAAQAAAFDRAAQKDVLAFLKTFEQLQDLLANRVARAALAQAALDITRMAVRDAFDELEKRGAIADARRFVDMQRLRNRLVHEYPMDDARRAERINAAWAMAPALLEELERLAAFAEGLAAKGETP
jgi:predicted nucleotidyltransferase